MLKHSHKKYHQAMVSMFLYVTMCFLATASYANNLATDTPAKKPVSSTKNPLPILYCPPINTIKKSSNYIWTANVEGGWKSTDRSFAKHLTRFVGAQWQGVGVGNIVCFYQASKDSDSFYVELSYSLLTKDPVKSKAIIMQDLITPNNWIATTTGSGEGKQTIMTCSANDDINNCPFLPGQIIKKEDPDKILSTIKQNYHPLSTPNL